MYSHLESEPFDRWRFVSRGLPTQTPEKRKPCSGEAGLSLGEARGDDLRFTSVRRWSGRSGSIAQSTNNEPPCGVVPVECFTQSSRPENTGILAVLKEAGDEQTPTAVAKLAGMKAENVRVLIRKMVASLVARSNSLGSAITLHRPS